MFCGSWGKRKDLHHLCSVCLGDTVQNWVYEISQEFKKDHFASLSGSMHVIACGQVDTDLGLIQSSVSIAGYCDIFGNIIQSSHNMLLLLSHLHWVTDGRKIVSNWLNLVAHLYCMWCILFKESVLFTNTRSQQGHSMWCVTICFVLCYRSPDWTSGLK